MYTILMRDDKSLTTTKRTTLFQREKLVDKIQFLLPQTYGDLPISECTVVFYYTDPSNTAQMEILTQSEELYKEHIQCLLPVDTKLSRLPGDNVGHLTILRLNAEDELHEEVLKSGEVIITISPTKEIFIDGDMSLSAIDQRISKLMQISMAQSLATEALAEKQVDDLALTENGLLQVTAKGVPVGQGVNISSELIEDALEEGVPVVDFSVVEPEMPDGEVNNVVEF